MPLVVNWSIRSSTLEDVFISVTRKVIGSDVSFLKNNRYANRSMENKLSSDTRGCGHHVVLAIASSRNVDTILIPLFACKKPYQSCSRKIRDSDSRYLRSRFLPKRSWLVLKKPHRVKTR